MKVFSVPTETPRPRQCDDVRFYICVLFGPTGTALVRFAYTAADDSAATVMAREFLSQRTGAARYEVWHRCTPSNDAYQPPRQLASPMRYAPLLSLVARVGRS